MAMSDSNSVLVEVDARGRVSLGKLHAKSGPYLATVEPDGSLILEPAVVLSESQRKLLQRPDILRAMSALDATPAQPSPRGRPRRTASK